jgi:hypothetical protein
MGRWGLCAPSSVTAAGRWQVDQTAGLQFQKKASRRHILEPARAIAPAPGLGQKDRKFEARPLRMLLT